MNLAYKFSNINGEKIFKDLSKLVSKIPKNELDSLVLVISLQKIQDLETSPSTLTIEHSPTS